jgi:hypothetical protein
MATIATLYKSGEVEGNSAYTHHPGGMFIRKTVLLKLHLLLMTLLTVRLLGKRALLVQML